MMGGSNKNGEIRLLFVAPLPPPYGGVCFLTKALLDAGLGQGFHLSHLNTSKNSVREEFGRITWLDLRKALQNFARFVRLVVRERPQILYLISTADTAIYRDWVFVLLAKSMGSRILLHLHGTRCSKVLYPPFHRAFVRKVASLASYIAVPTDKDLAGLKKVYNVRVPSEVIRNTVHVPNDLGVSSGKHEKWPSSGSLVAIGRLSKAKGAWDLFQALALVLKEEPSLSLTWIGLGAFPADDEYARELCKSLGIASNVRLAGQVTDFEKYLQLKRSEIFALPTHSEGFPLALLEAMAAGLPLVTTSVGGIPEVVKDGVNGYLVQPQDIKALANRIVLLHRDTLKRQRMGQANSRLFWENLSAQKTVARIHEMFLAMSTHGALNGLKRNKSSLLG